GSRLFRLPHAQPLQVFELPLQSQTRATGSSDDVPFYPAPVGHALQSQTRATGSSDGRGRTISGVHRPVAIPNSGYRLFRQLQAEGVEIVFASVAIPNSGYRLFRHEALCRCSSVTCCCNPKLGLQALPTQNQWKTEGVISCCNPKLGLQALPTVLQLTSFSL